MFSSSCSITELSPTVWFQLMDFKARLCPGYDIHDELTGSGSISELSVFVLRTKFSSSWSITELSPTVWFQLLYIKARLCPGYDIHDELTCYRTSSELSVFVLRTMFSSSWTNTVLSPTVWFQLMDFKARLCPGYDIHDELTGHGT